jgi:hypothetical protein
MEQQIIKANRFVKEKEASLGLRDFQVHDLELAQYQDPEASQLQSHGKPMVLRSGVPRRRENQ